MITSRSKHIIILSFLVAILFATMNCNKSNPVANNYASGEIIPLKVGNTWVWQISNYDTSGAISSTTFDSVWVSQDTIVDGQKFFLLWEQYKQSDGTISQLASSFFARNLSSGFSRRDGSQETVIYNYPYKNGDSTVIGSNVSITLTSGTTYICIVYQTPAGSYFANGRLQTLFEKSYICPNIGIVKKEIANSIWVLTRSILY